MRFFLLFVLYIFNVIALFSQVYQITTSSNKGDKYLIASLPKTSGDNFQKLKIEILGGNFHNDNLGSRVYTISTRNMNNTKDLVRIAQEQRGGSSSRYALKVYETSSGFDFVFETTEVYVSVLIQAWLTSGTQFDKVIPISAQEVKKYIITDGVDITYNTNLVQFIDIYTTDNYGNIGIGTITPRNKLDVNGTIRATEIKVETGWADFVFKKDYNLPSLDEVEDHINTYSRLPEIPSEQEVKENGVSLGEMQVKLLQKIEELTLYVIEQSKENKSLKKQIDELKSKLDEK